LPQVLTSRAVPLSLASLVLAAVYSVAVMLVSYYTAGRGSNDKASVHYMVSLVSIYWYCKGSKVFLLHTSASGEELLERY
jgi:hypothetical protein